MAVFLTPFTLAFAEPPLRVSRPLKRLELGGYVVSVRFSRDGRQLAIGRVSVRGQAAYHVEVFDRKTWKRSASWIGEDIQQYSPDGRYFLTRRAKGAGESGDLRLYRLPDYEPLTRLAGQFERGRFSPSGKLLVTERRVGTANDWHTVSEVWSVPSLRLVKRLAGEDLSPAWWPASERLLVDHKVGGEVVRSLIDARRGRVVKKLPGTIRATGFTHDARWGAGYVEGKLELAVWDMESLKRTSVLSERAKVNDWSISPNGRWIATAGDEWATRLWETRTGRKAYLLSDPTANEPEWAVDFSPDGKLLATGGKQGLVRMWRIPPE